VLLEGFESEAVGERVKHYLFIDVEESKLVGGLIYLKDLTIWSIGVIQARFTTTWMIIYDFLRFLWRHPY
jgi:hypothetical protein